MRGFTLVEMLVAIGITVLMMLLVQQMFSRTSAGVQQGVAVADVIATVRAVSEKWEAYFNSMLGPQGNNTVSTEGPASGGILIITQPMRYDVTPGLGAGVFLAKPHGPDNVDENRQGQFVYRPVHVHQLTFVRTHNNELPTTPYADFTFESWDPGGLSLYQLVRIGHGVRTQRDGNALGVALGTGEDQYATDWVLTCQALFLGEQDTNGTDLPNHPANVAEGARYHDSTSFSPELFWGTTDYAWFSLSDVDHPRGCLVGENGTDGNFTGVRLHSDLNAQDYHVRAVDLYTYMNERLRVNPTPEGWESWQIAQQHPFLVEHVSDFIVEFAADIYTGNTTNNATPDGMVDRDADGNIRWYSYWCNDPEANARRVVDGSGNHVIIAYNSDFPTTYAPPANWAPFRFVDGQPTFVWRHDDDAAPVFNAAGTGLENPGSINSYDAVTTPPDPNRGVSKWPHLLRIRYRVHDKKGILKSGDNQHGMWFEQIVKVQRP